MWGLGQSPILLPQLGGFYPQPTTLFGPSELEFMQSVLDRTGEDEQARLFDGLERQITRLKLEDSVNSKMAIYAVNNLKGMLSEEASRMDDLFPDTASHAVLLGPSFPQDAREVPIASVVAAVSGTKVVDDLGLFGDPHWGDVPPSDRMAGYTFRILSGAAAGEDRVIVEHRVKGPSAPCIVLDDATGVTAGVKFKVLGISLPQANLDKRDRSTDWAISTAILDAFDAPNTSPVIRSAYWTSTVNLKGREIVWNGTTYKIVGHTIGVSIDIDGSPPVGLDPFRVEARSPFSTGKMRHGTLRSGSSSAYDLLEPGTKVRLTPRNLGNVEIASEARSAQKMIDRYLHLRFQKYFGSYPRLRRFRKTARMINRQWEQEQKRREDIIAVAEEMNLPIRPSE